MTTFFKSGNSYVQTPSTFEDTVSELPLGTYSITVDNSGNFVLKKVDSFTIPSKLYGDIEQRKQKILTTYHDRSVSTGVLLAGEKGSGKTMLAKCLCDALKDTHITILVNSPFAGEAFNSFIQSIRQPTILLFDEFEKIYDDEQQEALLTLFDGTASSKKLYLVTCNYLHQLSQPLINRPGRMYYKFIYEGLEQSFIEDYCNDHLKYEPKKNKNSIKKLSLFSNLNFDVLQAIVAEVNRFKVSVQEAVQDLNFDIHSGRKDYEGQIFNKKKELLHEFEVKGNPLEFLSGEESTVFSTPYFITSDSAFEDTLVFASDLTGHDLRNETFTFKVDVDSTKDVKGGDLIEETQELKVVLSPKQKINYSFAF
jgi:hypothetical protein